jgi:rubrerythrin
LRKSKGDLIMGEWREGLGRAAALAERFADEGYMNLNKLLEAGVYSQTRRAAWEHRPKVTRETMQAELETSLQFLEHQDASPGLLDALREGNQGLLEERNTDLQLIDAPDCFVCRTCGHLSFSEPPAHCPDCGSWPGRFRKFVAVFNMDNYEPINPVEVMQLFARNAEDLAGLVEGLPEETLSKTAAENEWSIRDHVAHFYDAQEMLDTRLELMLKHEDPELEALAIYENAAEEEGRPAATEDMLHQFLELRRQSIELLEGLPLRDLWRTGRHSEFGRMTIIRQVTYLAYHEQTHLPEIEALRGRFTS